MTKNKALLIWNIVITTALILAVISGCASLDPQYASMVQQVKSNRTVVEQLTNQINDNSADINKMKADITTNKVTIATMQGVIEASIAASQVSMQQYVQQYVQSYVAQAVQ